MRKLALAVAIVVGMSSLAHALITTRVVVVLGVKLTPEQAKTAYGKQAELRKLGLELFDDPSMLHGNPQVTRSTYVGRVLGGQQLDRNRPTGVVVTPPSAADIEAVKKLLAARGFPETVQVITLVISSGGK